MEKGRDYLYNSQKTYIFLSITKFCLITKGHSEVVFLSTFCEELLTFSDF